MARAFAQAQKSADEGGVPVGACLADGDTPVSEGHNRRQQSGTWRSGTGISGSQIFGNPSPLRGEATGM